MQTIGPYRLVDVLGRCDIGVVWSAVDDDGMPVSLAVMDESVAEDERWRRAFSVTTNALSRIADGGLPVVQVDFDAPAPWVASRPEPGLGPAQIFVALGVTFTPTRAVRLDVPPVVPVVAPVVPAVVDPTTAPVETIVVSPERRVRTAQWVVIALLIATLPAAAALFVVTRDPSGGPAAPATSHVPGTFVASLKMVLSGKAPLEERQGARLALYSFRDHSADPTFMTLRMDSWTWDTSEQQSDTVGDCEANSLLGKVIDGTEPDAADASRAAQCPARGLARPRQRLGTYCGPDAASPHTIRAGDVFTIFWHDKANNKEPGCRGPDYERWRYSPRALDGGNLAMIELVESSEAQRREDFYAGPSPYQADAPNVGWGFGAQTSLAGNGGRAVPQIAGRILHDGLVYNGYRKAWNNGCAVEDHRNEPVGRVSTAAESAPWKLTDGTLRGRSAPKLRIHDRSRTPTRSHDVFTYLSVPNSQSTTNRRINLGTSTDTNDNGHVADDVGRLQSGLQIIGADGDLLGFVSVEVARAPAGSLARDSLGALYYLRSDLTPDHPTGAAAC